MVKSADARRGDHCPGACVDRPRDRRVAVQAHGARRRNGRKCHPLARVPRRDGPRDGRSAAGGTTVATTEAGFAAPSWVALTRDGDTFSAFRSANGDAWTLVGTARIPMEAAVYAGLAVTSHDNNALILARF